MSHDSSWIMMGIGGFFLILSIICFGEARNEDKRLNNSLIQRMDVQEFVLGPIHIESAALRWGGGVLLILAAILIIMGIVYLVK